MTVPPFPTRCPRRGFTLVETVTAVAVSSVLLLALGSTVMLASRAVPTGSEAVVVESELARDLERFFADIEVATDMSGSKNDMYLAVPDRDGDGIEEVIYYQWSTGDRMLTRSRNRGDAETLFGPITGMDFKIRNDGSLVTSLTIQITIEGVSPNVRSRTVTMLNTPEARR